MCFISNIIRRTNAVTFNMGLCSLTLTFMQFKLLKSEIHLSLFDLCLFLHSLTHFHRPCCILHFRLNSIDCLICTRRTNELNPIVATLIGPHTSAGKIHACPFSEIHLNSIYQSGALINILWSSTLFDASGHSNKTLYLEYVGIIMAYNLDLDSIKLIPHNEFLDPIYLCANSN